MADPTGDRAHFGARPTDPRYVVAILALAYVSSFIDRQILGLLVAPIRRDLAISDTQMSVLLGLSFALFYSVLGFPLGRLADAGSRRTIIAVGIGLWSVATALSGVASSYGQIVAARAAVGVGEAALAPAAFSLIADAVSPARLATALSVFSIGIYFGAGLANIIGGSLIQLIAESRDLTWPIVGSIRPWQSVFFVIGLPGLVLAALVLTIREPARRGAAPAASSVGEAARFARRHWRALGCHHLGFGFISLVNFATASWLPTAFIRGFGWTATQAGYTLGALTCTIGVAGVVAGGRIADRLRARGRMDAALTVGIIAATSNAVFGVLYTLAPTAGWSVLALVPFNFFAALPFGAAPAAIQEVAPNRMRAQLSALYLFVLNILGLGVGPSAVALLTDRVFGRDDAVRLSLLAVTVVGLALAATVLAAGRRAWRAALREPAPA